MKKMILTMTAMALGASWSRAASMEQAAALGNGSLAETLAAASQAAKLPGASLKAGEQQSASPVVLDPAPKATPVHMQLDPEELAKLLAVARYVQDYYYDSFPALKGLFILRYHEFQLVGKTDQNGRMALEEILLITDSPDFLAKYRISYQIHISPQGEISSVERVWKAVPALSAADAEKLVRKEISFWMGFRIPSGA
jgi:hypothetical protein